MAPSRAPTWTVSPSLTEIDSSEPSAGEGTSTVTLSVSSSSSGSSRATASPSFLNQRATVASVTDSPIAGTLISTVMVSLTLADANRARDPALRFELGYSVKASARNAFNSALCWLIRPAAVDAYSGRPT